MFSEVLFINAVNEVKQEKTMGFLEANHIDKIFKAYQKFESQENFAELMSNDEVLNNKGNMAISLYVQPEKKGGSEIPPFEDSYENWIDSGTKLKESMNELFGILRS